MQRRQNEWERQLTALNKDNDLMLSPKVEPIGAVVVAQDGQVLPKVRPPRKILGAANIERRVITSS